jgi:hypothetical protein
VWLPKCNVNTEERWFLFCNSLKRFFEFFFVMKFGVTDDDYKYSNGVVTNTIALALLLLLLASTSRVRINAFT